MLTPLQLPPGLERNGTPYETPNRFWDSNLVRWQSGNMLPVGGWVKLNATPMTGAVRKIHVYRDNSNQKQTLVGTDSKLYVDNGGSYVDITPSAFVPLTTIGVAGGYGTGLYGIGTYGTARPLSPAFSPYAYWTMDNWGEDIIMTANSDGRLFYYTTATATTAPAVITTAPINNNAVVVTAERHVMAIGQNTSGGSLLRVAWSSREDYTDWDFASVTNTAGFQDLDAHSPLLTAVEVREGHLILGNTDVYLAQYVGQPFIYGFTRLSDTSLFHPSSVVPFNGTAAWISANGFQYYAAGSVQSMDCPILRDILDEMDSTYGRFRFHGCYNGVFKELWWFYPTAGNTEANRYIIWNYLDNWWAWGMLSRSAMSPGLVYKFPLMGTSDGIMYEHENGLTDNGTARFSQIFAETGALTLSPDGNIVDVNAIQMATIAGSVGVTAYAQYTADGPETTYGPYTARADGYMDTRFSGRNARLRYNFLADISTGIGRTLLDIPRQKGCAAVNINLPPVGPNAMVQLIQALRQAFGSIVSKDEAAPRILLSDSNMQIWEVAVTTTGTVTTTTISGKDRGA